MTQPKLRQWASFGRTRYIDTDGDRVPDIVDCRPKDPRKQGVVGDITKSVVSKYKQWKAESPIRKETRYQTRVKSEQRELESLRRRAAIERERATIERTRLALQREREKARPKQPYAPSLGLWGSMTPPTQPITKKVIHKKRLHKKRRGGSKPSSKFAIIGGKAYPIA